MVTTDDVSLDGRTFAPVRTSGGGEVGTDTVFHYHQDGDLIWASYNGGHVRVGRLVGTRDGSRLAFRYVQVNEDGDISSGQCQSKLELLDDGRFRAHEEWRWESKRGSGTSVIEERAD